MLKNKILYSNTTILKMSTIDTTLLNEYELVKGTDDDKGFENFLVTYITKLKLEPKIEQDQKPKYCHKTYMREYMRKRAAFTNQKIPCELCNILINRQYMPRHMQSDRHQALVKKDLS